MLMDAPPPTYTSQEAPPPAAYDHNFPRAYTVNQHNVAPFVTVTSLKRHLRLLGAFHSLKERVQSSGTFAGCTAGLHPEARWSVFVAIAVHRYELYLQRVVLVHGDHSHPPPLDVALVHHTYTLNPKWYQEDMQRVLPQLSHLDDMLLEKLADSLHPYTFDQKIIPDPARVQQWEELTETPFDPLKSLETSAGRYVRWEHTDLFAPWVTKEGAGYAQQGFSLDGPENSYTKITHETLGVFKFIRDIIRCRSLETAQGTLAGSLFAADETSDASKSYARAVRIRTKVVKLSEFSASAATAVGLKLGWTQAGARKALGQLFPDSGQQILNTILSAYGRGEEFSLDLSTAVLRQGTFVEKMHNLGWTAAGRFDEDDSVLHRSIARYHAYLDLIASENIFVVPTLDIDLAWHTHQLTPSRYKEDTIGTLSRFVDHDDRVEEDTLSHGYDDTAKAWQARFGVPYSACGCPLPPVSTVSSLTARLKGSRKETSAPSNPGLTATASSADPDSTHPSEHPSVVLASMPQVAKKRAERVEEHQARVKRDDKKKGKGKSGGGMFASGGHDPAFLRPVAFYSHYGEAGYPSVGPGCAAVGGHYMGSEHCPGSNGATCTIGTGLCAGGGAHGASECGVGGTMNKPPPTHKAWGMM